jgi:hypothetical protein
MPIYGAYPTHAGSSTSTGTVCKRCCTHEEGVQRHPVNPLSATPREPWPGICDTPDANKPAALKSASGHPTQLLQGNNKPPLLQRVGTLPRRLAPPTGRSSLHQRQWKASLRRALPALPYRSQCRHTTAASASEETTHCEASLPFWLRPNKPESKAHERSN